MASKLKIDSELRLIIHLLRANRADESVETLLQDKVDWEHVLQLAEEHRVVPLLFKKLKSADFIGQDILAKFQNRYQEIAAFNFARSTQLIKLTGALQANDLPVISYKGMALAQFAYNDITLRQFGDIDILIQKKDFFRAKEILMQLGCQPAWDLSEKQEKGVLKYYYEYPFFYGPSRTYVEVHWEFIESFFAFDLKMEDVWNRAQTVTLYGKDLNTLSAEDYLLVLCTHGSKHFWYRLSWVCDIAKLVENTAIDWDLVKNLAEKTGCMRMVRLGLHLARELLKTELPDEMIHQISNDPETIRLGEEITNYICGSETEPTDWIAIAKLHLRMREKMAAKIKYSRRLLTTKLIDKLFMPMGRPR